jgi:site-specific recombinase XerD
MNKSHSPLSFGNLLQDFFCQYLMNQRNLSPRTVASYRDAFRLLLNFVKERKRKSPAKIQMADLDPACIVAFLRHLEHDRRNGARSRNARLMAIRCFLKYAATREPTCLTVVQRVLAIPGKRFDRPALVFLSQAEIQAILESPDSGTFSGARDRVLLALMYNSGARVSEIASLRVSDLTLGPGASLRLHGKGRKERSVPLWKSTARLLRQWIQRIGSNPDAALLPNAANGYMTRSGIAKRFANAVRSAQRSTPSLQGRQISPHTIRHTTAMHLLQSGVDITVIAIWLGHSSTTTTHHYVEADLLMKQKALGKLQQPRARLKRYKPSDALMSFLQSL